MARFLPCPTAICSKPGATWSQILAAWLHQTPSPGPPAANTRLDSSPKGSCRWYQGVKSPSAIHFTDWDPSGRTLLPAIHHLCGRQHLPNPEDRPIFWQTNELRICQCEVLLEAGLALGRAGSQS